MATTTRAAESFADAVRARRRQMVQRVMLATLACLVVSRLIGWDYTTGWVVAYVLAQGVETWAFAPINSGRVSELAPWRMLLGCTALTLNAAVFGALSVPLWLIGGPFGGVCGALLVAAAIINCLVNTPGSRRFLCCTIGPQFAYMLMTPAFMGFYGAGKAYQTAVLLGCLAFCGYAVVLWRALERTRRSEAEARAENERKRRELEAAMASTSVFVATVSHELRTPISAMLAGAAELQKTARDASARSHAVLIADAGRMMKTLLDDILDHSKLEAGRMSVECVPFNLRSLIAQTARFWQSQARKKGLKLRVEGAATLPAWVEGDPTRLRQILNNLISNAVKFTDTGSVTLAVSAWAAGDDAASLQLQIVDTGAGMDAGQLARLFTPFEQVGGASQHGGTGLGLAISRQLARLMGGHLTVRSTKGQGSAFILALTLPLGEAAAGAEPAATDDAFARFDTAAVVAAAEAVEAARPAPEPVAPVEAAPVEAASDPVAVEEEEDEGRPLRVLVADDHEINRRAVQLVLAPTGAAITTVCDGKAALDAAMAEAFDVIVMDVRMPEMNGREATRRLRAQAGPNQHVPVIAVTADTDQEDVQACRDAGMNWFVGKPIDPGRLLSTVAEALDEAARAAEEQPDAGRQVA